MHETRNFCLVIMLIASVIWATVAWFILGSDSPFIWYQRVALPAIILVSVVWLIYALMFEEKLHDHLKEIVGDIYYDADGLSFMPMIRARGTQAELSVYYQNRFENPVDAIVHLRPPQECFIIRPGMRDVHFAFNAKGGAFGVIHQPIAIPEHLQGELINVQLAAASWYPRSHGSRLLRHAGLPCGALLVDWGGAAFRTGVHEVSGEIELINPVTLHLSLPAGVNSTITGNEVWTQEQLAAGIRA